MALRSACTSKPTLTAVSECQLAPWRVHLAEKLRVPIEEIPAILAKTRRSAISTAGTKAIWHMVPSQTVERVPHRLDTQPTPSRPALRTPPVQPQSGLRQRSRSRSPQAVTPPQLLPELPPLELPTPPETTSAGQRSLLEMWAEAKEKQQQLQEDPLDPLQLRQRFQTMMAECPPAFVNGRPPQRGVVWRMAISGHHRNLQAFKKGASC